MKSTDAIADAHSMLSFPPVLWGIMGVAAAGCVLHWLHAFALAIEHEQRMEEVRRKAAELRKQFARQLRGEPEPSGAPEARPLRQAA